MERPQDLPAPPSGTGQVSPYERLGRAIRVARDPKSFSHRQGLGVPAVHPNAVRAGDPCQLCVAVRPHAEGADTPVPTLRSIKAGRREVAPQERVVLLVEVLGTMIAALTDTQEVSTRRLGQMAAAKTGNPRPRRMEATKGTWGRSRRMSGE